MSQVQTLLQAEKEASLVVAKAKEFRTQRLKDARSQALLEIEALKKEKNREFMGYEDKFKDSKASYDLQQQQETNMQLSAIKTMFAANKDQVVQRLVGMVGVCEPVIHRNAKQK